jgi:hypothetical protein
MKNIILCFILIAFTMSVGCSKKSTCAAYNENQKEDYKIKKTKRKKSKMF